MRMAAIPAILGKRLTIIGIFFDGSGYMITGWVLSNNFGYYCETSAQATAPQGSMITGWREIDNEWYFFETAGTEEQPLSSMITGWYSVYYFRKKDEGTHPMGSMVTGAYTGIDDCYSPDLTYCFEEDGEFSAVYADVIRRKQERSNWWWVASAEMIGKYFNPSCTLSQTDVVEYFYGFDLNWPAFLSTCRSAIEQFGGDKVSDAVIYGSALDLPQTRELIRENCPMVARLSWSLTSGHLVVLSGYDFQDQIRIIDPWEDNPTTYVPYYDAVNEYNFQTGTETYDNTILVYW